MAPGANKANYKSYEAQARMVRAIVAAHPDVKWNYKDIVACFGSDMTEDALSHRFRLYRAEAAVIRQGRQEGRDMKDLKLDTVPKAQNSIDKNIAKYFGQSTADGMQFQFRTIKKDAETLRRTEREGGDVANCLSGIGSGGSTVLSTPVKNTSIKTTPVRGSTGSKRGRKPQKTIDSDMDDDIIDSSPENWSERDETPSKRKKTGGSAALPHRNPTPSRRAAARAADTIRDASAQLQSGDSNSEAETPSSSAPFATTGGHSGSAPAPAPVYQSLFGGNETKPNPQTLDSALSRTSIDPYVGGNGLDDDPIFGMGGLGAEFYGDGEC